MSAKYPEINVEMQAQKWLILHQLGLPVAPTFRIDPGKSTIVRTDITEGGKWKIYDTHSHLPENLRNQLKNLKVIKDQVKQIAVTAYNNGNGVLLSIDSFALLVDDNNNTKIMLHDLGMGSLILQDNKVINTDILLNSPIDYGAQDFITEVLEGIPPPENIFYGG